MPSVPSVPGCSIASPSPDPLHSASPSPLVSQPDGHPAHASALRALVTDAGDEIHMLSIR